MNLQKHKPLIALCLGLFMVIMDASVVNVALPCIALKLHADISALQWVVAGYALTFSCFLLLSGQLADQVGAKKILLTGLTLFLMTSLACGLATSIVFLIFFRIIQGIAAAMLIPTSLALINTSYEDKKDRAKAIGIWGSIGGIAAASGPGLGGILTAAFGWPAIFFINVPVGLLAILLLQEFRTCAKLPQTPMGIFKGRIGILPLNRRPCGLCPHRRNIFRKACSTKCETPVLIHSVNETKTKPKAQFDVPGQLLSIIMIASIALGLIEAGHRGWMSTTVIFIAAIFLTSLFFFIKIEKKTKHPMIPLDFFRVKNFSIAIVAGILLNIGMYGELFCLPLYFHQVRGYNTLMTGFAVLPLMILVALSSYLAGKLASYKGAKLPMYLGFFIAMLGFFGLLITGKHTPSYYWLVLPLAMIGFGVAFTTPAATFIAVNAAPEGYTGIASGIFTTGRQVGSLIGVAVFGSILATSSHFVQGFHMTLIAAGLLFFLGFLISCFINS